MSNEDKYDEPVHELSQEQVGALENALSQELAREHRLHAPSPSLVSGYSDALSAVLAERLNQKRKWGDAHDDEHGPAVLALQACSYLLTGQSPLKSDWSYRSKVINKDPRRVQLVKGVALALAALEAHDRAAIAKSLGGAA